MNRQPASLRLTHREISTLVYKWIGATPAGELGNFTHQTHDQFWRETCDIITETAEFPGTIRECFEATLFDVPAGDQATILREILEDYPFSKSSRVRTANRHAEILAWIARLEAAGNVIELCLDSPTDVVRRVLSDADALLKTSGPQSAVDRIHTALHAYLHTLADDVGIDTLPERPTMNQLFKAISRGHPAFANLNPNGGDILRILHSISTILDALNPIRNNASAAHPNQTVVGEAEALLVINVARTLLAYFEAKRNSADAARRVR